MTPTPEHLSEGNRYSVLLNPIRDLAASWGVDVAQELSEYAESLGMSIGNASEDNDDTDRYQVPVDFAEAALLVQGSTSIYSRKVEHLYSLVYIAVSTLNQIRGKARGNEDGVHGPAQNDADADALLDAEEIDFLALDDDIPQADPRSITLGPGPQPGLYFRDETRLPPIPAMLVNSSGGNPAKTTPFKIATSRTHPSGALIMAGCPVVNEDLETLPCTGGKDSVFNVSIQPDHIEHEIDDDDGFIPMELGDCEAPGPDSPHVTVKHTSTAGSQVIMETAELYGFTTSGQTRKPPKSKKDPFLMLDPHLCCQSLERPTRRGRTYKKPRKVPKQTVDLYPEVIASESNLVDLIMGKLPRQTSAKTYVSCAALHSQYAVVCRKRRARHLRDSLRTNRSLGREGNSAEYEATSAHDRAGLESDLLEEFADVDLDDCDGPFENPHECSPIDAQPDDICDDDVLDSVPNVENGDRLGLQFTHYASSFEETCRLHLEKTAWMWEQRTTDINLVNRVAEWTSRIQPLLEEEDGRPEFDIAQYGRVILADFDEVIESQGTDTAKISTLFQQPAKFEVCRKFLATLQLANNYSVEIIPSEGCTVQDFFVKIASSGKENIAPFDGVGDTVIAQDAKAKETNRAKRLRQPGSTPKSARRQPLRPRLQLQNFAK